MTSGVECSSSDPPDEDVRAMLGKDSSDAIRVSMEDWFSHSQWATVLQKRVDSNARSTDDSQQFVGD